MKNILFIAFCFLLSHTSAMASDDPEKMLADMDSILRSRSHDMTVQLDVNTKKWQRQYKIRIWMQGVDLAFARVLEPAKVRGQSFLREKARLWNYLPTAERTILIPPSMMLNRFMGSDFTNDDFVKLTYLPRDYDGALIGEETLRDTEAYHLELIPKPDAPVIYGKLEIWLRKIDSAPLRIVFYNEKMVVIRTLDYSHFKKFGEHETPTQWVMKNHQDEHRMTTVKILEAQFNHEIPASIFTKDNLESES